MAEHVAAGGIPASKGYSDLLRELLPGAMVDICYPGDPARDDHGRVASASASYRSA